MRVKKKAIILIAVLSVLFAVLNGAGSPAFIVSAKETNGIEKIAPQVQKAMASPQADEMLSVIVTLKAQADLSRITDRNRRIRIEEVINALQIMADATQNRIQALLQARASEGKVSGFESFWVFNGLSVTATPDVIAELAALPEVDSITPNGTIQEPIFSTTGGPPEPNLSVVNAPALWDLGFQGQGIVVANMDTGVDLNHPDLIAQWRGGTNSWFDPNGEYPTTPTDVNGHGTWTMGAMVGRDAGGTAIGVAPQAQWIAVKIFNNQGSATMAGIHAGFQWLLDPDGNPGTDDTPHVVNNSWTFADPGCNLEFQLDLIALRAAGILPVFAAGNAGPGGGTSVSPSNNPEAFAVGATDNNDLIYVGSSRGPSACSETQTIFPEMVAPGVSIHTSDLFGLYTDVTGTSLAAPHVAGGLALLLDAYPNLITAEQEAALLNGGVDLGPAGPDNDFGHGRLDILVAHQWLSSRTEMYVAGIDMLVVNGSRNRNHAQATVTILDASGVPVSGATLSGSFSGDSNGSSSDVTDANGQVTFASPQAIKGADWTFCVEDVTKIGYMYTPDANLETCDSTTAPQPTNTPTPTATPGNDPTPTPTPTPTASPNGTMHVGDLDGSSSPGGRGRWNATVFVTVHDANEAPLAGATVNGTWGNGVSGSASCVTDTTGQCSLTKSNIKGNVSGVTLSVDSVAHSAYTYMSTDNHDPDGDSDGTTIAVLKP